MPSGERFTSCKSCSDGQRVSKRRRKPMQTSRKVSRLENVISLIRHDAFCRQVYVQGSAKRWALGYVNSRPAPPARGSQEAGLTFILVAL